MVLSLTLIYSVSLDDHTRVKLNPKNNVNGSDYINASFVVREKCVLYMPVVHLCMYIATHAQ